MSFRRLLFPILVLAQIAGACDATLKKRRGDAGDAAVFWEAGGSDDAGKGDLRQGDGEAADVGPSDGAADSVAGDSIGGDGIAGDGSSVDGFPADGPGGDSSGEGGPAQGYCALALKPSVGYAAYKSVTGGLAFCAQPTVVDTLNDSGPGSLRAAIASGRYIVFAEHLRDGTLSLQSDLVTTGISNVTIDGRASDGSSLNITLTAHALKFDGPQNVIIGYLSFVDNTATPETDGLTMRGQAGRTPSFYLVHNTFDHAADGALDIIWKRGGDMWATLEANLFRCTNMTLLINASPDASDPREGAGRYHITMLGNWFDENVQRQPLARSTDLHYFNNVITQQGNGGRGPNAGRDTRFLLEDNAFESGSGGAHCAGGSRTGTRFIVIDGPDASVTARDNLRLDGGSGPPYDDDKQGAGFVSNALTPPYPYTRTPMDPTRMQGVMAAAGNQ